MNTLNIDEPLVRIAPGALRFYQTDALGSVIALTDETGAVRTKYSYDPFGNVTISGEASDNPFQYTSRENDGTGLYYYRARYYSPELQRFISEDPIRIDSGDLNFYIYVDSVEKPRIGTNLYQYAANNPVNYTDPLGLKEKKCDDCDQCVVSCGCQLRVCACSENRCGKVSFLGLFTIDPLGCIVGVRMFSCDEFYGAMKSQPYL